MNQKVAKRVRKEVRKLQPGVIDMFTRLRKWPFRQRLVMAWLLLIGIRERKNGGR